MSSISSVSPAVPPTPPTATTSTTPSTTQSATPAATTGATGGDGTGPVATQVLQWASIVADGSGASVADKANAYVAIHNAIVQGIGSGTNAYFSQTTLAQRQQISDVLNNSSFAQQARSASSQFGAQANAADHQADATGGDVPPSQSQLAQLNQLSADQQQLVFAGLDTGFSSLDAWKTQLQKDQDTQAAQYAADNPGASVKITLSPAAQTALAASKAGSASTATPAPADPNATALQTLSTPAPITSADVGLAVLQNAAQAKAAADTSNTSSGDVVSGATNDAANSKDPNKPYQVGDRVSVTA